MKILPTPKHINCKEDSCMVCLKDCTDLAEYLEEKTEIYDHDILGIYRTWLDKKKIPAETEYGWFTENVFNPETVNAFIKDYT